MKNVKTRFRAYQLGTAGSSFSYFSDNEFTLIEARINDQNRKPIQNELSNCNKSCIDTLHITSWDQDHCAPSQLEEILNSLKPNRIEYPGYRPTTDCGNESLEIIEKLQYQKRNDTTYKIKKINPEYIKNLDTAKEHGYNNVYYHPKFLSKDNDNDNSTVKLFRSGCFNVLSLGDVESQNIAAYLRRSNIIKEVDILILAHHGAANGFTTSSFLKKLRPQIAIASADFANQFKHPKQEIRDLLRNHNIPLYTTKTGDILCFSTGVHVGKFSIANFVSNNRDVAGERIYRSKKLHRLSKNADSVRNHYRKSSRPRIN